MSTTHNPTDSVTFSVPVSRAILVDDREYAAEQVAEMIRKAVLGWAEQEQEAE